MRTTRALAFLAICVVLLPTASPVRAASCNGASHALTLSSGGASPGAGSTSTSIRFSVQYADNAGCDPSRITVAIPGVGTFPLGKGGTSAGGVTYSRAMTLPAGVHAYSFAATSGSGAGEVTSKLTTVSPRAVTITAPTPAPTPRPPTPTIAPGPAPTVAPVPIVTTPPAPPSESATASPAASDSPSPSASPTASPGGAESPPGTDAPSPTATEAASAPGLLSVPRRPIFPRAQPDAPPDPSGIKDPSGGFALRIPDVLVPWTATTTAGLVLFLFLVRRREARPEHPMPSMVLSVPSAGGAVPPVTPLPAMRELVPPIVPDLLGERDPVPAPPPEEVGIPRWLRPSVREARFSGSRDPRYGRDERR